jgi:glycosyltransferase involved in cell wall biosynthesis
MTDESRTDRPITRSRDHPITRSSDRPKLRIAYLLESADFFGGVKVALVQAEALARRGHRVAVVCPGPPPSWFPPARARYERSSFDASEELAAAEVRVATFWTTIEPALKGARGPVFHLCQGYEGEITHYADRWDRIEAVYRLPARRLAVSAALCARLESRGLGPVFNVGQVFDRGEFSPGPERPVQDPPVVIVVGPLEIDFKGVGIALEGLRRFRERGGVFRLRRVSYFPPGEPERRFALADEYHHLLPPERMPFAYRASDLFVGGSRPEEGFGLPTLEALSAGLPCLLSDTPGQREIGADAAWYFPDGDPAALAARLPELLTEESRRRARREGPAAASRFDTARVAERLEGVFLRALAGC